MESAAETKNHIFVGKVKSPYDFQSLGDLKVILNLGKPRVLQGGMGILEKYCLWTIF